MQTRTLAPVDRVLWIFVIIEISKYADESFQGEGLCFGALIRDKSLSSVSSHWIWNAATIICQRYSPSHMLPEGGKKKKRDQKRPKPFCYVNKINHSCV